MSDIFDKGKPSEFGDISSSARENLLSEAEQLLQNPPGLFLKDKNSAVRFDRSSLLLDFQQAPIGTVLNLQKTQSGLMLDMQKSPFNAGINLKKNGDISVASFFGERIGTAMNFQKNGTDFLMDFESAPLGSTFSLQRTIDGISVKVNDTPLGVGFSFEKNPLGKSLTVDHLFPQPPLKLEFTPDGKLKMKDTAVNLARGLLSDMENRFFYELPALALQSEEGSDVAYKLNINPESAGLTVEANTEEWMLSGHISEKHSLPRFTDTLAAGREYNPKFLSDVFGSFSLQSFDNQAWINVSGGDSKWPSVSLGRNLGPGKSFTVAAGHNDLEVNADLGAYSLETKKYFNSKQSALQILRRFENWQVGLALDRDDNKYGASIFVGSLERKKPKPR